MQCGERLWAQSDSRNWRDRWRRNERVRKRENKEGRGNGERKSIEGRTLKESKKKKKKVQNLVRKISFYASKIIAIFLIPCLLDLWTLQRRYSGRLVSGISHSRKILHRELTAQQKHSLLWLLSHNDCLEAKIIYDLVISDLWSLMCYLILSEFFF